MKNYTKNQNYRRAARQGRAPRYLTGWFEPWTWRMGPARQATPAAAALAMLAIGGNL